MNPLTIAILSRNARLYSTRRLKEAAAARGHKVRVLDTLRFSIFVEHGNPSLLYKGKSIKEYDAVVPRIGASITFFGAAVVRQFEQMGMYLLNTSPGILSSRDKLRSMQVLSKYDIGLPPSAFIREKGDILPAIEQVGGAPVIIKLLEGTQGVGVILAETTKVAEAIVETLHSARQNVLIQKFVAESKGKDIRAFVVGDRVVAAMRRRAQEHEFRSNVHRGGHAEPVELDPAYERCAIQASQIMGLKVAGVDMLETTAGPQVLEVNSSPGLEGIEGATGVDVAGAVIEYLEDQIAFPEFDIRQRLTVSKGYGVAEVWIHEGSSLAGIKLMDSGLRERDIVVLTIHRDGTAIANPMKTREIKIGDRLLCFGKLSEIKTLIPPRPKRKKKKKTVKEKPAS